ncbi:GNAT family N-acetyltransferase [Niveispirillum fermenti]|uniref:GNAT family N-acetyltransferase n=1 Tax=Niveispirillum fermenti TaxID=1233113 RepID=UPI003A853F36
MVSMPVVYAVETRLRTAEFIDVLKRSGLAERRPIDDPARIEAMLRHANLIVTARVGGLLVGVARSVTDFAFCCYLSDLAVDAAHQGRGIGKRLMRETRDAASRGVEPGRWPLRCLLLSAPGAMSYYPQAGLTPLDNAFDFTTL